MRSWVLLSLVLAGCAPTVAETRQADARQARSDAKLARALKGLTPGPAQTCLSSIDRRNARIETYGSTTLYRVGRGRVFRNDMNGGCGTNTIDPIYVTQTPSTQLCRGDIAQLIDRASRFPIGSCAYGDFVPYTRAR
jgi:hypothetical protein